MAGKHGINNPMQKGERRINIHEKQNKIGNDKNKPEYTNYEGEPIVK